MLLSVLLLLWSYVSLESLDMPTEIHNREAKQTANSPVNSHSCYLILLSEKLLILYLFN